MATSLLSPNARQKFDTLAGAPAAGYKIYTYAAGTTTPQATYSNRAGTVANTNPIILDARGECVVYLTPGLVYDYKLTTAADVLEWTQPGVSAQAGDAAAVNFTQAGTGAIERPAQDRLRDKLSVLDFIASQTLRDAIRARTTTAADKAATSAALQAACAAASARTGVAVYLPAGKYWADSIDISAMHNLAILGDGPKATQIITDSATAHVFTSTSGNYRTFADFWVDSSVTRTAGSFFNLALERRSAFDHVLMTNWFNAVNLPTFEVVTLSNCFITTPSGLGDALILGTAGAAGQGSNVTLIDCFLRGNDEGAGAAVGRYGIASYDVDAIFGFNCDIGSFVESDLLIAPTTRSANHHFVQTFFDATKNSDCIRMQGAGAKKQMTFNGCWVASAGKLTGGSVEACGLKAQNVGTYQDINFSGTRFYNNSGSGALLEMPSADFHFAGGSAYSNGATGVTNRHGIKWAPATAATAGPSIDGVRFGGNLPKDISIGANAALQFSVQGVHLGGGIDYAAPLAKASGYDPTSTAYASATRPVISPLHDYVRITGTTNIAGLEVTYPGHLVTMKFDGVLVVIDASQNLALVGNFTTAAGSTLTLRCDGATWWEVARANT